MPGTRVAAHRHVRQSLWLRRCFTQPCDGPAIGQDVAAFGHPDVCRHRHYRDSGNESGDDGQHRVDARTSQHRDRTRGAADAFGCCRRRTYQVGATPAVLTDTNRVREIGRLGVKGRQQHEASLGRDPSAGPVRHA